MKIHTLVGAEILQRVAFPYPVAPIVRSHHERWDGTGYPDGLKGEQIPRGARVLAAVDCLDALSSHRQYRNAMSLDAAMEKVASIIRDGVRAQSCGSAEAPLPRTGSHVAIGYRVTPMITPAIGDEARLAWTEAVDAEDGTGGWIRAVGANCRGAGDADFLSSIASARQEAQTMFELSQDLGNSLSLGETLSVLSIRLRKMVPYDSMAVFLLERRQAGAGTGERRQLPPALVAEHWHGRRPVRLGRRKAQADHQWQSRG
jgi:hypothetical protein